MGGRLCSGTSQEIEKQSPQKMQNKAKSEFFDHRH